MNFISNASFSHNFTPRFLVVLLLLLTALGCKESCEYLKDDNINIEVKIERLEEPLFAITDKTKMEQFLAEHPTFSNKYLGLHHPAEYPFVSDQLLSLYQNKALVEFYKQTLSIFKDIKPLEKDMGLFFDHVKYHFPAFYVPPVKSIVTGFHFEKDLLVSDSLIVISLDYFLGSTAKFRPPYFNYFLDRYQPAYILPMIALGVSGKYNLSNDKDESMLSNMVYYGKAMYFAKKMLPCTNDSLIVMYNATQMEDIKLNEPTIWAHFIEQKLLFETNRHIIDKYVGESPKVNEIGEKCPGRIGRWLGWQIVNKYMENNPKITLPELMAEQDAQKIFAQSKYKPKK
jgi:gliding motility-associated lipoprotein GldB